MEDVLGNGKSRSGRQGFKEILQRNPWILRLRWAPIRMTGRPED